MGRYRILVVEDSPTMRQLITFTLKRLKDVDIIEASDGVDGLKKIAGGKFDIIFTDINMPIMDGQACQPCKKRSGKQEHPHSRHNHRGRPGRQRQGDGSWGKLLHNKTDTGCKPFGHSKGTVANTLKIR